MSLWRYLIITAAIGLAVVAVPSAASAQAAKPQTAVSDSTLDQQIESIIEKDARLKVFDIDVDVANSVVTLTGKVRTDAQKAHAASVAKIAGVMSVQNDIVVDANAPMGTKAERAAAKTKEGAGKAVDATKNAAEKAAQKTKEVAGKTADTTKKAAGKTAEKTKEAASTTGEVITDAWITTKVKAKMIDESTLKDSDINVDTSDHVVTLKGTVTSQAGKARAEDIAKTTDGVKRVVNQLVIKPS